MNMKKCVSRKNIITKHKSCAGETGVDEPIGKVEMRIMYKSSTFHSLSFCQKDSLMLRKSFEAIWLDTIYARLKNINVNDG